MEPEEQSRYHSLSDEEAQREYDAVEAEIIAMEDKRATHSKEFIALLKKKLAVSQQLKRFQEVNNCEMRIRFIEARMRGEEMPTTELVNFERKARRKRRNNTNTMLLLLVAVFVVMIGSVPMIKMMVERNAEIHDAYNADTEVPIAGTADSTTESAEQPAPAAAETPAAPASTSPVPVAAPTATVAAQALVEEVNKETGGDEIYMAKLLKPGRTTIFKFSSVHCPLCISSKGKFDQLAKMYPEHKFYTVDIDRPFSTGIDFESPVAKQWDLHTLPYYMIFEGTNLAAKGEFANKYLRDLYMKSRAAH
jgi:thiol-disulfide isomerase/thioredoxin